MYKQSIILFGIVLPLVVVIAVLAASAYFRSGITTSFAEKTQHYTGHERSRITALEIEALVKGQREISEGWQETLSKQTTSLVTTNLREITEKLPPKEFQQTSFPERLDQPGGFGGVSAQKSSGLKFSFRGTYRTVQRAFLELETRMPNLQLQELKIDPMANSESSLLNFQVVYSAWEN